VGVLDQAPRRFGFFHRGEGLLRLPVDLQAITLLKPPLLVHGQRRGFDRLVLGTLFSRCDLGR
jgi:hypothetical protein